VVVLVWNPVGGFWSWYYRPPLYRVYSCGVDGKPMTICYTLNREHIHSAAAIVFGMPWMRSVADLPPRIPGQKWIGVSLETNGYFPQMPKELSLGFKKEWGMDLTMTYELNSDIPTSFFSNIFLNSTAEGLFKPPWVQFEEKIPKIGFMYSNCNTRTKRTEYIEQLMQHFPADAYGRCLYNIAPGTAQASWEGSLGLDREYSEP